MRPLARIALVASLLASISVLAPSAWARRFNAAPGPDGGFFVDPANGNDGNSCRSATAACRTIAAAVTKSGGAGTITIASGTYAENLSLGNVQLALVGAGASTTTIDGGGNGRVITWAPTGLTGSSLSISGVTIQNGVVVDGPGAGLYASGNDTTLTLSGVVVTANQCSGSARSSPCFGGGLYFDGVKLTASDVTFSGNDATFGAGLFFTTLNATVQSTLTRVTFEGNVGNAALYVLGTLTFGGPSPLALHDVTFTDNVGGIASIALCNAGFAASTLTFAGHAGVDVSIDSGALGGPCA